MYTRKLVGWQARGWGGEVRKPIDKWDLRFLELASLISTWSRDPSTKVGAVIVRDRRILSTGYNGLPAGVHDFPDRYTDREAKLRMTVHAERNALDFASRSVDHATIYCTAFPCPQCAASLVNTGISRVVSLVNSDYESRYVDDLKASRTMFEEVGIWVDQPTPEKPPAPPPPAIALHDFEPYECESCAAKPGSPTPCARCLRNRAAAGDRWQNTRPPTA